MKLRILLGFTYATMIVALMFALVFRYFGPNEIPGPDGTEPLLGNVDPVSDSDSISSLLSDGAESGGAMQSKAVLP